MAAYGSCDTAMDPKASWNQSGSHNSAPGPATMDKRVSSPSGPFTSPANTGFETPFVQTVVDGNQIPRSGQPTGSIVPKP